MGLVVERFLICDGHCGRNYGVDTRSHTVKELRDSAKKEGWIFFKRTGNDYCPDCNPQKK